MCKLYTGLPMCITSRAAWNYLHAQQGDSTAALEVNCKATTDRRPHTDKGGSGCWYALRNGGDEYAMYRYGTDDTWASSGKVDWYPDANVQTASFV